MSSQASAVVTDLPSRAGRRLEQRQKAVGDVGPIGALSRHQRNVNSRARSTHVRVSFDRGEFVGLLLDQPVGVSAM